MKTARILVLADIPSPALWDYYNETRLEGIDLIISCGDLPAEYLSFLATVFRGDVLYIPGNHDQDYQRKPPLGCIDIDEKIYRWKGLRILGLGGSIRYKPGPYQYTQDEMHYRVMKLFFKLWRSKGIDILVTHAPAAGINDGPDRPHEGFTAFVELINKYRPAYFIHGHVHMNYGNYPRITQREETTIVNAYEKFVVEVPLSQES